MFVINVALTLFILAVTKRRVKEHEDYNRGSVDSAENVIAMCYYMIAYVCVTFIWVLYFSN